MPQPAKIGYDRYEGCPVRTAALLSLHQDAGKSELLPSVSDELQPRFASSSAFMQAASSPAAAKL